MDRPEALLQVLEGSRTAEEHDVRTEASCSEGDAPIERTGVTETDGGHGGPTLRCDVPRPAERQRAGRVDPVRRPLDVDHQVGHQESPCFLLISSSCL